MKIIKKIFVTIIIILICFGAASYLLLRSTKPNYSGKVSLPGLNKKVEIIIDEYGVPHIYAENSHDAYMALGYVQAQERLFQMEMILMINS